MKVVVLAGGRGSRLREETQNKPKTLVEIGGKPLLWHIMRHFIHYGYDDFIIATGYLGETIEEYLKSVDLDADILVIDTGEETETGGRLGRLSEMIAGNRFMMTWSDGVSNINLNKLESFHRRHGRIATVSAVRPPPRFGQLRIENDRVTAFNEKHSPPGEWINGAFFVLESDVFSYLDSDGGRWEDGPMRQLVNDGQLCAYRHRGFWGCVDTIHDLEVLRGYWKGGHAPWVIWD